MQVNLTSRIQRSVRSPASTDAFDVYGELAHVLADLGLTVDSGGGNVQFTGADPIVPSTLRLGAAAGIALAAKSLAMAALLRDRGGPGQDIAVDLRVAPHRLCPFYDQRWELLNGYPGGSPSDSGNAFGLRFYQARDGRWVMPLNPYPAIKAAAQRVLKVPEDEEAVAAAVARREATELEEAGAAAGIVLPMLRTTAEFLTEPQYLDVLCRMPLIEITRIADGPVVPLPPGAASPLLGIRALGMGHVIAGAGAGRALALHGADVLNVWRPGELEQDVAYLSANVGVRSCTADPASVHGRFVLRQLLATADVFFANRRPGYLESIGLSSGELAELRPGIVHATVSLNGRSGPWADRIGFDQTAGSLVGMMLLEGGDSPALPPIKVVNHYITAWFLSAGIVQALRRRAVEGGSYQVHVSLTRVALWILSMGIFDLEYAIETAGNGPQHSYLDPDVFTADTPLGRYQGVTEQVSMSVTPGQYRTVLVPRGSCPPEWLDAE